MIRPWKKRSTKVCRPDVERADAGRHHNHELRHLLEKHQLAPAILVLINGYLQEKGLPLRQGTIVDTTITHALSSTKNKEGKRDPEMHQTKKGINISSG